MAIDGRAVQIIRQLKGISAPDLADRLGIKESYLRDIESADGRHNLKRSPQLIQTIADELGVPLRMISVGH